MILQPTSGRSRGRGSLDLVLVMALWASLVQAGGPPSAVRSSGPPISRLAMHRSRVALSFEDRVACERVIQAFYWRERIWPKENPRPKPSLDEVLPPQ